MKIKLFYSFFLVILALSFATAKNDPNCGTNGPAEVKIIGGVEATPYEFPWMVSFGWPEKNGSNLVYHSYCGGSIIHPQFVLTAGHCTEMLNTTHLPATADVAVHNVSFQASEPRKVSVSLDKFIRHPKYKIGSPGVIYDLALVKLKKPLDIARNPDLGTICVPSQNNTYNPYQSKLVTAAGWGQTVSGEDKSRSKVLLKVTLPIANMDWCKKMYKITEEPNTMICTYKAKKDACHGDSGGPLMMKADDGRWTVVGITSWGHGCAVADHPGMWTHVSLFSDWIWETVKANGG